MFSFQCVEGNLQQQFCWLMLGLWTDLTDVPTRWEKGFALFYFNGFRHAKAQMSPSHNNQEPHLWYELKRAVNVSYHLPTYQTSKEEKDRK